MMSDKYPIDPTWNIADTFTVQQAAALIAGFEPHSVNSDCGYFCDENGWTDTEGIEPARVAYAALINAITDGTLKAMVRCNARLQGFQEYPNHGEYARRRSWDENLGIGDIPDGIEGVIYKGAPDWNKTTIKRKDLTDWLKSRGVTTGFFFPEASDTPATAPASTPDYLNPKHPHYTPKLAAAVKAWQALADIDVQRKSVKQALGDWLLDHAHALELMKDDGNPNYTAIDEIAKVANWNQGGGAPKTPTPTKPPA